MCKEITLVQYFLLKKLMILSIVQEAAGISIDVLIAKGDLYDAERYAQVTYGNLRDKKNGIDQNSAVVAQGAHNLANVIYQQKGDMIKAEELTRESLRIKNMWQ
jgi:Rad3-related DNA helicase